VVPISRLGSDALVTGLIHRLREGGKLGRYSAISRTPGFRRAVAGVIDELRAAGISSAELSVVAPDLTPFLSGYEKELADAGFSDWTTVFQLASRITEEQPARLTRLPILFLDVSLATPVEAAFLASIARQGSNNSVMVLPTSDIATLSRLRPSIELAHNDLDATDEVLGDALSRLQRNLFVGGADEKEAPGDEVAVFSAPGEGRESVEIARRVLRQADNGIRFDSMAVLLRSPGDYRSHLEEAFARAGIPAFFAQGASRPDPAGRAFVALLQCAAQNLSAQRFAEYLSLSQLPAASQNGAPPDALPRDDLWVPDDDGKQERPGQSEQGERPSEREPTEPIGAEQLRAPRRWERLLVEAAVIGGRERWERRINGLINQMRLEIDNTELDETETAAVERELSQLEAFADFSLPLIGDLAALPQSVRWGEWFERLGSLATRALKRPDNVLRVLSELAPMAEVGPVTLGQVLDVLSDLLVETANPPGNQRYGKVFVGSIEAARGLSFDVVFVPGLAERKFPRKIVEEPLLLDRLRAKLGAALGTNQTRLDLERLSLSLAVDAARKRIFLSYPRINLDDARNQVPSFYALEIVRSAEGVLPDFAELSRRAEGDASSRLGWPAPEAPTDAIDDAEYDLAMLSGLMSRDDPNSGGRARYLLETNPHLARALRSRFQRWQRVWTSSDGLLKIGDAARRSLQLHLPNIRSYSATALQTLAACPYKFLLRAVHGLRPKEDPAPIDEMDPLQRGSLIHDVQFTLFAKLRDSGLLPLGAGDLERAQALLDDVLTSAVAKYRDLLAPAIDRVWDAEVAAVRTDLREWLRRASSDDSGFKPTHFELSFGLPTDKRKERSTDPGSTADPVRLEAGLLLRGSIDLVERHPSGMLRVTDHKTGKADASNGQVIKGGRSLQPVLYALAAEKLFAGNDVVTGGRLYFSTSRGGFAEVMVALDEEARGAAARLTRMVTSAIETPFLPAAPDHEECSRCEYRLVCGPYEEMRSGRKPRAVLEPLAQLREAP
jgi:RecB family exonuclease